MDTDRFSFPNAQPLLGLPSESARLAPLLRTLDVKDLWTEAGEDVAEIDLRRACGVELRFKRRFKVVTEVEGDERDYVFSGLVYHSEGDLESKGFPGELPRGIKFGDDEDRLRGRIGVEPTETGYDPDRISGYLRWDWREIVLHALFLVAERRTVRVTAFLPHRRADRR